MSNAAAPASRYACPSAQPDMQAARVFGLLSGTPEHPRIDYLKKEAVIPIHALPALPQGMTHIEAFRFTARCEEGRCGQYADGRCSLGQRLVDSLPPVVDQLPSCTIRVTCRWYAEQGAPACYRCPQVVTLIPHGNDALSRAAAPPA